MEVVHLDQGVLRMKEDSLRIDHPRTFPMRDEVRRLGQEYAARMSVMGPLRGGVRVHVSSGSLRDEMKENVLESVRTEGSVVGRFPRNGKFALELLHEMDALPTIVIDKRHKLTDYADSDGSEAFDVASLQHVTTGGHSPMTVIMSDACSEGAYVDEMNMDRVLFDDRDDIVLPDLTARTAASECTL